MVAGLAVLRHRYVNTDAGSVQVVYTASDPADMAAFDALPAWAKGAVNAVRFKVQARVIAAEIASGYLHRFNIQAELAANDRRIAAMLDEEQREIYGAA